MPCARVVGSKLLRQTMRDYIGTASYHVFLLCFVAGFYTSSLVSLFLFEGTKNVFFFCFVFLEVDSVTPIIR